MFSIFSQFIFGSSNSTSNFDWSSDGNGTTDRTAHGNNLQRKKHQSAIVKSSSWKDKSLCFDLRSHELHLNNGEQLIGCFYPIEDIKGNQDQLGLLKVTNMRLIWICCRKKRVNLSIGWRIVSLIYEQNLKDPLGGSITSLFVLTKYESTKYEFVFNKQRQAIYDGWPGRGANVDQSWSQSSSCDQDALIQLRKICQNKSQVITDQLSPTYLDDPFEVVFKVWQAYKRTQLFRHCRSNLANLVESPAIYKDGQHRTSSKQETLIKLDEINKLPGEEIIDTFANIIQSESKSIKYLGTLIFTNVRIIWIDNSLPLRNMSIPYIRIESIKLKQSQKILVNTHDYLGSSRQSDFRTQKMGSSASKLTARTIYEQMMNLFANFKSQPKFGPESCEECVAFISHLRPLDLLLDWEDGATAGGGVPENFGPLPVNSSSLNHKPNDDQTFIMNLDRQMDSRNEDAENDEEDDDDDNLGQRWSKFANYLGEQQCGYDNELIYSSELGLAIEKPKDERQSLNAIWRIDI